MTGREIRNLAISFGLFIIAALLPLVDTGYWLSIGVTVAMFTVLATSWALFSGPTHYISLASAAFFGIGMYIVAGGIDFISYPVLVLLAAVAGAGVNNDLTSLPHDTLLPPSNTTDTTLTYDTL